MKKILVLLLFALAMPCAALRAQRIALGERAPEIRPAAWLEGRAPAEAPMTYVEFYSAACPSGEASLKQLHALTSKFGTKLRVIVVTRDKEEAVGPALAPYLAPRFAVALDPQGRIFTAYGVSYIPFGVLLDARGRALWQGNTRQLTEETIRTADK